jgi:hypothetical protein
MTVVSPQGSLDQIYHRIHEAIAEKALIETFRATRPSVEERVAAGKALRRKVPRNQHAEYKPRRDRPDPVAILEKQNELRVQKRLR